MELLAPVGSKEAFITALRAGADAVYMGVEGFNARASSSSINLFDLEVLIDHARQKKVKVYLALNTLIKHEEIGAVVKSIAHINKLSPDAVIVQDMGVAHIINNYFPDIELHASTQMAVHNRMGADFLARNGFKRAVLARELSFSELKSISNGAPIGIEVFCHGALCFSLSGMCLFSSYIGGLSGNRGRCTQPCRRLWKNGGKHGYLFSPRDLQLAGQIAQLKKIGIASLKIEGRMRSSEYVYRAVKAYRMIIDAPDNDSEAVLREALGLLSGDMAREKTTCLFNGRGSDMFQPKRSQCLGNRIGIIAAITGDGITVKLEAENTVIVEGDRLRLSNPATDQTIAFKVKEFANEAGSYIIPFSKTEGFSQGNPVFKTVDAHFDQKDIENDIDALYNDYKNARRRVPRPDKQPIQTYTAIISNTWKELRKAGPLTEADDTLWVRFDDAQWLNFLPRGAKNARYVYYLTKDNMHCAENIPEDARGALTVELPPFMGQRELPLFKQAIDKMISAGTNKWVINNVAHFELFKGSECELSAGPFLYTWNAYTAAFLSGRGVKYFTASWEDDFLNIRKMCGPGLGRLMVVYLYGYAPVVRSRLITKEMFADGPVTEYLAAPGKEAASFTTVVESGLTLLIPEEPVTNFTARKKLRECGIVNFGIDLSFIKPDQKRWNTVFASYKNGENPATAAKFNFKRGVK